MEGGLIIPPSSNWYLGCISDVSVDRKIFVYGANCALVVMYIKSGTLRNISLLTGHSLRVNSLQFLPLNDHPYLLASCSQDKTVRLWNCDTTHCIVSHNKHDRQPTCLTISPLSPLEIVSTDEDGNIVIWQLPAITQISQTNSSLQDLGHFSYMSASSFNIKSKITIIQCSPTRRDHIILGYQIGIILIVNWKTSSITHRLIGHNDYICTISFCPQYSRPLDGMDVESAANNEKPSECKHLMVSGSKDKTIRYWNLDTGRVIQILQMPQDSSGKGRKQKDSRQRYWLAVAWNPYNPLETICSSHGGDILCSQIVFKASNNSSVEESPNAERNESLIDTNQNAENVDRFYRATEREFEEGQIKWQIKRFKQGKNGSHSRAVFNINFITENEFVTISMDRQIGFWDLHEKRATQMIHCPGGHVYSLDCTPLQPSCVAMGVGDQSILLWTPPRWKKNDFQGNPYDIKLIWRGIQSKVTAIKWHPSRDGLLGFGTDDGRIGYYDTLSSGKYKLFASQHKGIVYEVHWRKLPGKQNRDHCLLYTCASDGTILVSHEQKPTSTSKPISHFLEDKRRLLKVSSISWHESGQLLAIGQTEGSIIFLQASLAENWLDEKFSWLTMEKIHTSEIRCVRFHPPTLIEDESISYSHWIASSSKSGVIAVTDCSSIIPGAVVDADCHLKTWFLKGHNVCVTQVQWSPHNPNYLLSASYDTTMQLWDARETHCHAITNFRGHCGRVFACCFSLLHPDIVFSASDDHTSRLWSISSQKHTSPPLLEELHLTSSTKSKKKRKRRKTSKTPLIHSPPTYQKKDETLDLHMSTEVSNMESSNSSMIDNTNNSNSSSSPAHSKAINRKTTLFPSLNFSSQTKEKSREDCLAIAKTIYQRKQSNSIAAAGLDLTSPISLLNREISKFERKNDVMLASVLDMWKGEGVSAFTRIFQPINESNARAVTEKQKNMFMAISPQFGFTVWKELMAKQAKEKEENGELHTAVLFYLSIGEPLQAIRVYREAHLYQDGIMLAKIQLGEDHPAVFELYHLLANWYGKQKKSELEAQCYIQMKDPKRAIEILEGSKITLDSLPNLLTARDIAQLVGLEEDFLRLSRTIGKLYLAKEEIYNAKNVFMSVEDVSHVFVCAVQYAFSTLASSRQVSFASSRTQVQIQHDVVETNQFSSLFPTLTASKEFSFEIRFFESIWAFLVDLGSFHDPISLEKHLLVTMNNLLTAYEEESRSVQLTVEQKSYLSINVFSRCIIQFCLREYDEPNRDFLISWLQAINIEYQLHHDQQMKIYGEVFAFQSIPLAVDSVIKDDTSIIDHIRAFCVFSSLTELIHTEGEKKISLDEYELFEKCLLPSCLLEKQSILSKIDSLREEIESLMLRVSLLDLSKKQSGKKRKKEEFSADETLDDTKSLSSLQEELESLQIQKGVIDDKNISKLPFPEVTRSKLLLQQVRPFCSSKI